MISAAEIREAIERARTTPELLEEARLLHASIASQVLSRNHDRIRGQLRISDAGSCTRELWARDRGLLDIPEDPKAALRMDNGSLFGAWLMCLLKAALEEKGWYRVKLEVEVGEGDIPGHIDAAIFSAVSLAGNMGVPAATVEAKWTAKSGKIDPATAALPSHRLQSGKYAQTIGAPQHFVVTYFAASWATGEWLIVTPYNTEDTDYDVALEYDRLSEALGEEMPAAKPPEAWLCRSCKFSACERNENPLRASALLEKQLEASVAAAK